MKKEAKVIKSRGKWVMAITRLVTSAITSNMVRIIFVCLPILRLQRISYD